MNPFDVVVTAAVILGAVLGFMSGLVRSLATILAYLIAAPIAVAIAPTIAPLLTGNATLPPDIAWMPLFAIFIVAGVILGALFRHGANEFVGTDPPLIDRIGGALLGAVRILLVAVLIVVIFDRIIPADRAASLSHRLEAPALSFRRRPKRLRLAAARCRSLYR